MPLQFNFSPIFREQKVCSCVYENRKEQHIHTKYWLRFDFIRFWNSLIQIYQIDAKKKCNEMLNDTSSHQ